MKQIKLMEIARYCLNWKRDSMPLMFKYDFMQIETTTCSIKTQSLSQMFNYFFKLLEPYNGNNATNVGYCRYVVQCRSLNLVYRHRLAT